MLIAALLVLIFLAILFPKTLRSLLGILLALAAVLILCAITGASTAVGLAVLGLFVFAIVVHVAMKSYERHQIEP